MERIIQHKLLDECIEANVKCDCRVLEHDLCYIHHVFVTRLSLLLIYCIQGTVSEGTV